MRFEDLKPGNKILCIQDLVMTNGNIQAYRGNIYEITRGIVDHGSPSVTFENESGNRNHSMGKKFFHQHFIILNGSDITDKILNLLDI